MQKTINVFKNGKYEADGANKNKDANVYARRWMPSINLRAAYKES